MHAIIMVHKMQRLALVSGPAGANPAMLAQPQPVTKPVSATSGANPAAVVGTGAATSVEKQPAAAQMDAAPGDWELCAAMCK